jgi:hypothetical protein
VITVGTAATQGLVYQSATAAARTATTIKGTSHRRFGADWGLGASGWWMAGTLMACGGGADGTTGATSGCVVAGVGDSMGLDYPLGAGRVENVLALAEAWTTD